MQTVAPAQAAAWLDASEAILIDVREPVEFAAEHIEQATSMLGQVAASMPGMAVPEGRRIIVMCLSGGRSSHACMVVNDRFPDREVYDLAGGLAAWKRAGLPVVAQPAGPGFFRSLWQSR